MDILRIDYRVPSEESVGWAEKLAEVTARMDLKQRERAQLEAALQYFRRELGEDWPGWREHRHLATQFFIRYNTDACLGVELHSLASAIAEVPNAARVIRGLGEAPWEKFVSSRMELALASTAATRMLPIEIPVEVRGGDPTPDLRIGIDDRLLTIECLRMQENHDEKLTDALGEQLLAWTTLYGFATRGRLTIMYENVVHVREAMLRIEEIHTALLELADKGAGTVELPRLARVALDPQQPALPSPLLQLPYIDRYESMEEQHEARRLMHRIREKARQLREPGPTLLIVHTRAVIWPARDTRAALKDLGDTLCRWLEGTRIGGVMVHEDFLASGPDGCLFLDHKPQASMLIARRAGRMRSAVLARNLRAPERLTDAEVSFFINAAPSW